MRKYSQKIFQNRITENVAYKYIYMKKIRSYFPKKYHSLKIKAHFYYVLLLINYNLHFLYLFIRFYTVFKNYYE